MPGAANAWRRKRDSFVRNLLMSRKLLIFRFAQLAGFAARRGFGSFDRQTRYSAMTLAAGG
jgi:hypothetical protein